MAWDMASMGGSELSDRELQYAMKNGPSSLCDLAIESIAQNADSLTSLKGIPEELCIKIFQARPIRQSMGDLWEVAAEARALQRWSMTQCRSGH
jgi:hypothetical protein